jgi:serpin B
MTQAPASVATSAAPMTQTSAATATPTLATADPATSAEIQALANSSNAFALDFYAKIRARKGNLVASPFSIHTALAMTWAGAKGETADQMKKVLHLDSDRAIDVAGGLLRSYGAPDQKVTIRIANRLFGEKTYVFEAPYLARVNAAFGAPLEPLDFRGAAQQARGHINDWVAKQTEDRIKDLIPEGGITPQTRLVLTNAIYFLGAWATAFKKEATRPAPFFTSKTDQKDVPMMHQSARHRLTATDGVKVLDLPYENGALAMTFVLPNAIDGLDAVEARLTPKMLETWLGAVAPTQVIVSLPKLEIAPAESLSLSDTLAARGMPLAFDEAKADFTRIANPPNPGDRLFISGVIHKAFVKVDEKGTEAAAATAVVMESAGAPLRPTTPPLEFKADHPFLYLLRDTRTGLILFMGRVADPAAK